MIIGEFLGPIPTKKLMKGQAVPIGIKGISMRHEGVASVQKAATPKIGLVFYVSEQAILNLDDLNFDCLIFVPWLDADGKEWAAKWNAQTAAAKTEGAKIDLPREVVESLESLTISVNLSTGLGHTSDKENAKRKFSLLQEQGIYWNPVELEKWAVRNGWKASDAKELSDLSAKYV
jgi:hypothetical protein